MQNTKNFRVIRRSECMNGLAQAYVRIVAYIDLFVALSACHMCFVFLNLCVSAVAANETTMHLKTKQCQCVVTWSEMFSFFFSRDI